MAHLPSPHSSDEIPAITLPPLLETVVRQRRAISAFPFELSPASRAASPESEARATEIRDAITRKMRRCHRGVPAILNLVSTRLRCGPFTRGAGGWGGCGIDRKQMTNSAGYPSLTRVEPNSGPEPIKVSRSQRLRDAYAILDSLALQAGSKSSRPHTRKRRRLSATSQGSSKTAKNASGSPTPSVSARVDGKAEVTSRFFQSLPRSEENLYSFDASPVSKLRQSTAMSHFEPSDIPIFTVSLRASCIDPPTPSSSSIFSVENQLTTTT